MALEATASRGMRVTILSEASSWGGADTITLLDMANIAAIKIDNAGAECTIARSENDLIKSVMSSEVETSREEALR